MASGHKAGQVARPAGRPSVRPVIDPDLVLSLWGLPRAELRPSSSSNHGLRWPFSSTKVALWFRPGWPRPALSTGHSLLAGVHSSLLAIGLRLKVRERPKK